MKAKKGKPMLSMMDANDILERLNESETYPEKLPKIKKLTVDEVERIVNGYKDDERWTALESALVALGDGRLIIKYCANRNIRWHEMEPEIRKSDYVWNYCRRCLRGMPVDLFLSGKVTMAHIDGENNEERRRIYIDFYGISKFIKDKDAKLLDTDVHKYNGIRALIEVKMTFSEQPLKWLVCSCPSSGHTYYLAVSSGCTTCEEADEFLSGIKGKVNQIGRT